MMRLPSVLMCGRSFGTEPIARMMFFAVICLPSTSMVVGLMSFPKPVRRSTLFLFKKNKVERLTGFGKLINPTTIDVDGKQITAKNIILAMGSVPKDLPHIKTDGKRIINSDHIRSEER